MLAFFLFRLMLLPHVVEARRQSTQCPREAGFQAWRMGKASFCDHVVGDTHAKVKRETRNDDSHGKI